jgi:hypothetical protein
MDGERLCYCLELPDRENRRNVSRIPAGQYVCKRVRSARFGETFEITNVPGRSGILFHVGNFPTDTHGCILLGMGKPEGKNFISESSLAVSLFNEKLAGVDSFFLEITDPE